MRLDPDCVREILIYLEKMDTFVTDEDGDISLQGAFLETICQQLPSYPKAQVFYTLKTLDDGGFLNMTEQWGGDSLRNCHVSSLTYVGHEFLESIRDSNRWKTVKMGLASVKNYSLSAIEAIAEGLTSAAITAYLSKK